MSKRAMLMIGGLLLVAALGFVLRDTLARREAALVVATLVGSEGEDIARDDAQHVGAWRSAALGERFGVGDGLRTGPGSQAKLRLADDSELSVMPDTTLRFLVDSESDASSAVNVGLERGEALVHTERDLALMTQVGEAFVKAGSTVKLDRAGSDLGISVQLGSVRFRDAEGTERWLKDGSDLRIAIGMAVLGPAPGVPSSADAGSEAGAGAEAAVEEEDDVLPSAGRVQLQARAGESFVLHSAELPVSIAFDLGKKCPGEAQFEVSGKRQALRGKGVISLSLSAGSRAYTIRCTGNGRERIVARGTVRVLKDAGTQKLPPKAPTSIVEADGRMYTIYYPNQLPDILVRWPNPPEEPGYLLEIDGKSLEIAAPEHLLKSGELGDGIHQLSFRGKVRRSRTTTVEIRFDNNAPTAALSAPDDRSFMPGSPVKVEGVALEGWKVSLEGGTIARRSDGRFSGTIAPTAERPDIAVRLSHPRLGVHYYLRRAASSP